MAFEMDEAIRRNHAAMSPMWVQFLDHAVARPEWWRQEQFTMLHELASQVERAGFQPWPTLIDRARFGQFEQLNSDLCRLLKAVPERVFGDDTERLVEFYDLPKDSLPLLRFARKRPAQLDLAIGRSDLVYAADGFKCLEFNISANAGGWVATYQARRFQEHPLFRRFLAASGAEVSFTDIIVRTLSHALSSGLKAFRSTEINVGIQVDMSVTEPTGTGPSLAETYQTILQPLGLEGRVHLCVVDQPEAHSGKLYLNGDRIHVLVEFNTGPSSVPSYRCWMNDSVLLINGPMTPILTDKRNLALASELVDSGLFDARERALIEAAIPWTRRMVTQKVAGLEPPAEIPAEIVARREDLVIKPAGGSGGAEVVIGATCSDAVWAEHVERAYREGTWVAQRMVRSLPYYYLSDAGEVVPHDVIWGLMLHGERYGGDIVRTAPRAARQVISGSFGATMGPLWAVQDS